MTLIEISDEQRVNPLEVVERVASSNGWSFERASERAVAVA